MIRETMTKAFTDFFATFVSITDFLNLNFELFIAKRIISGQSNKKIRSKPLIGTAILAIALGLAVMVISVAILTGFKKEITNELVGFSSHIQIVNLNFNNSFETDPIQRDSLLEKSIATTPGIRSFQPFATKPGILRTNKDMEGVVLKGVDQSFNWDFIQSFLIEGETPNYADSLPGNQIVLSRKMANRLMLSLGDKIPAYFIQDPPRARPFVVGGIYETGLEEYDLMFVFCDIRHLQIINGWSPDEITGYEIFLHNYQNIDQVGEALNNLALKQTLATETAFDVRTIKDTAGGFFDFLRLIDTNLWVVLVLMLLVSGFNMISGLFILILERTNMIGILKALGANNQSLRRVFLIQAGFIIGLGLLFGDILGISLALVQQKWQVISLDPVNYFVDSVPIRLNLIHLILLNLGTLVLTLFMLLIPSGIISKISPAKTIKFD